MKNIKTAPSPIILGLDFGTSGLRAALVKSGQILTEYTATIPFPERDQQRSEQSADIWQSAFENLMSKLAQADWTQKVDAIIADATSSSVLISNDHGQPISVALMYDDKRARSQADKIAQVAPADSAARGANSSLAKLMWLAEQTEPQTDHCLQHQIDWLNFKLCGVKNITDENNALKLGYDSIHQTWPDWVSKLCPYELPNVVGAGSFLSYVSDNLVKHWQFKSTTQVYAGTTDSIAAFLASGASELGDAVTALGSTLAIKQLSDKPLFAAKYGIYSHKLKDKWLVGGASNTGGAVLLAHFNLEQLKQLIPQLNVKQPTGFTCYPLIQSGERFPVADPNLTPIIPKTGSDAQLLQALIEGLVAVETQAYRKLESLGAPKLTRVYAVGGGTRNQAWCQLRTLSLPATIARPISQSAAFGVTRLIDPTTIQGNTL